MKKFFPNYLFYVINLLDRYNQFISSKDPNEIRALPYISNKIKVLLRKFSSLRAREGLTEPDQIYRNLKNFRMLLMELEELG